MRTKVEDILEVLDDDSLAAIRSLNFRADFFVDEVKAQAKKILDEACKTADQNRELKLDALGCQHREIAAQNNLELQKYQLLNRKIISSSREKSQLIMDSLKLAPGIKLKKCENLE